VSIAAASAAVLLLPAAGSVHATDTLDQQVPTAGITPQSNSFQQLSQMAQTFTAGLTGPMDNVALYIGSSSFVNPSFRLEVWTVDTTRTTLTAVGTPPAYQFQLALANNARRGWQTVPLSPAVPVQAGHQYALVLKAASSPLLQRWFFMGGWTLAGSNMWLGNPPVEDTTRDFAFQTYVAGAATTPPPPANTPPTLDPPVTDAVLAPEGSVPSNTGTYSDPDSGDTVALTASSGALTRTGTNRGSWSWTGTPADEGGPVQTVTITANDGHNPAVTRTFTVTVYAVNPTVTITPAGTASPTLAAASAINEGTALNFNGAAHSPATDDNSTGFNYAWSVTKDGAAYPASSASSSFSFTPNDEGSYVVTLAATDDGKMTGTSSFTISVGDVLPTAVITAVTPTLAAPKIVVPYEVVSFSGTFTDPGTADPHAATWSFGDGTTASGWNASHFYTQPGSYIATLTVSQGEDPGVGTAQTTVAVLAPAQALSALAAYVQTLPDLNAGQRNSLAAKLNAASAAAGRGDANAATNQLNAFLNELVADVKTGKVSNADAANLEADVAAVKGALGYNPFLDFWPLGI
jgi:PKD domain